MGLDIFELDILGLDILGLDILGTPQSVYIWIDQNSNVLTN